ncbi:MAG: hypothetical protein K8S18_16490 [Desulfobacula sp.]|nr:hypothetical protein [Desulfobacula sp.]
MIQVFPPAVFTVTFLLFSVELIFILLKKERMANGFGALGILTCLAGVLFIVYTTRRPPLFGPFEAGLYIVFILALLGKAYQKKVFLINSIAVLFVLAHQFGEPFVVNDDYFMYDNIWVILFFNLRLLSAAFFVHAMVLHLSNFFQRSDENAFLLKYARYHTLFGVFIYLCSEWSGSLWCLNWFGDSWRWSSGFFKASILFLLVMAACHLPQILGKNKLLKTLLGSFPGFFALWMIFYH